MLSLYLKKLSRKVIYVDSNTPENRVVMCKPMTDIANKNDDDQDLFLPYIHDKYSSRPNSLEPMCLAEFATTYRSLSTTQTINIDHLHEDDDDDDHDFSEGKDCVIKLQNERGFLCKRKQQAVLKTHRFREDKEKEKHYYSKLVLYLPWRDENRDLANDVSFEAVFNANKEVIKANKEKFNMSREAVDNALDVIEKGGLQDEDVWHDVDSAAMQQNKECEQERNEYGEDVECQIERYDVDANARMIMNKQQTEPAAQYSIDKQPVEMSDKEYSRMLNELNDEQADIVQCCGMMFRVFLFRSIPMFFYSSLELFSSRGCMRHISSRGCLPTPTHLSCTHADRHRVVLCLVRGCPLRMSVRPAAVWTRECSVITRSTSE